MKRKVFLVLTVALLTLCVLTQTAFALPAPVIDEGFENAPGGDTEETFLTDCQVKAGLFIDQPESIASGVIDIAEANGPLQDFVIDGEKSFYVYNYEKENMEGDVAYQWFNFMRTDAEVAGLNDKSTYVVSFILRTYTQWDPMGGTIDPSHRQNFLIVSVRDQFYYRGEMSLVDFYIQPNIQNPEVNEDQRGRVDDLSVPQNPKNTMSVIPLDEGLTTFSVVCKFVTANPNTPLTEETANKWFLNWTFCGQGIISIDNVKVYKSDLKVNSFHQTLEDE